MTYKTLISCMKLCFELKKELEKVKGDDQVVQNKAFCNRGVLVFVILGTAEYLITTYWLKIVRPSLH